MLQKLHVSIFYFHLEPIVWTWLCILLCIEIQFVNTMLGFIIYRFSHDVQIDLLTWFLFWFSLQPVNISLCFGVDIIIRMELLIIYFISLDTKKTFLNNGFFSMLIGVFGSYFLFKFTLGYACSMKHGLRHGHPTRHWHGYVNTANVKNLGHRQRHIYSNLLIEGLKWK